MYKNIYKNAINNIICITHKYPNEITKLNQIEKAQGIMLSCLAWFSRTQQRTQHRARVQQHRWAQQARSTTFHSLQCINAMYTLE